MPFVIAVIYRVTGGELFEDIVAREFYSEADARYYYRRCSRGIIFEKKKLRIFQSTIAVVIKMISFKKCSANKTSCIYSLNYHYLLTFNLSTLATVNNEVWREKNSTQFYI